MDTAIILSAITAVATALEKWAKAMAEEHGYREVGHLAEVFGICPSC